MEQVTSAGVPSKPGSPRASCTRSALIDPRGRRLRAPQWAGRRVPADRPGAPGAVSSSRMPRRRLRLFPFPIFFLPPSYTHRHYVQVARAPGGSPAGGPFPPPRFWCGIPKIDSGHTNRTRPTHHYPDLFHAWGTAPGSGVRAPRGPVCGLVVTGHGSYRVGPIG